MSSWIRLTTTVKSNGFRLSLWYAVSFVLGSASLLCVTYFSLSSALASSDREAVRSELAALVAGYNAGGLPAVDRQVAENYRFRKKNPFFLRIVDPRHRTLKIYYPQIWAEFDLTALDRVILTHESPWIALPARGGRFELIAGAQPLRDGGWLQVGMSSEEREATLRRFRATLMMVLLPVTLVGIIVGSLLALRALRPVALMNQTVASILNGKMEARIARTLHGDELDELARLFNAMLDKIESLIEGLKGSLDNVAHDLRTPMTRLRGVAEKALHDNADLKQARDALSDCVEESDRILSMLTMLMDISEVETGTLSLDRRMVNLSLLLNRVVDMYEPVAEEKRIQLTIDIPDELSTLCDGNRLSQAFANILDNAVKYTSEGGRIDVRASRLDGQFRIAFADSGTGISPEDLPRIWDRLFRGANAKRHKGLGLGLSFVKAICEAHNGTAMAESRLCQGSVFTLVLPAAGELSPSAADLSLI